MEVYRIAEYLKMSNPTPGESYRPEILTAAVGAKEIGGMFGVLAPGDRVTYHYHLRRESLIIFIDGEGTEVSEGREFPVKAGDILYIPAGEKHATINRSGNELRYLEFFTHPPVGDDFYEVEMA